MSDENKRVLDAIDKLSHTIETSIKKQEEMGLEKVGLVVLTLARKKEPTGDSVLLLGSCGPRSKHICQTREREDGGCLVTAYFDGIRCLAYLRELRKQFIEEASP